MRPALDGAMAAELPKALLRPLLLAQLTLVSGIARVHSGVGPLTWNSYTWSGLGEFGSMGGITENSDIQAAGTTLTLTVPNATVSVHEAMTDIRLGGLAKIWWGLLQPSGAFFGTPYLIFKGSVDQPSVHTDPAGSSITLALENRMSNLQRPSNRKYTAADQQLDWPNDRGFNWQEIIQEISLKQGS